MTASVRVLPTLDQFRLRLGWVRFLLSRSAPEGGEGEVRPEALREAVDRQDRWLSEAGITRPPLGKYSERAAESLLRMGVDLGAWSPRAPRRLTDLGEVTRLVAGAWQASPFAWERSARFIGLRLLVGADGDVLLPLLRAWPDEGTGPAIRTCITEVLSALTDLATTDEERKIIAGQAARTPTDADKTVLWPRLEPLRELGYIVRGDTPGAYSLSDAGRLVKDWLTANAEMRAGIVIESHLPQLHAAGEGLTLIQPAGPEALRHVLRSLPPTLTSGGTAAPIESVALLVHDRFLTTGEGGWATPEQIRALVHSLAARSDGIITLQNAGTQLAANVAWRDAAVLQQDELWSQPASADAGALTAGWLEASEAAPRADEGSGSLTTEPADVEVIEVPVVASVPPIPPAEAHGAAPTPPTPNLKAWWAHLLRLVRSDRLSGGSVLHGGPETILMQFALALTEGTPKSIKKQREDLPFSAGLDLWLQSVESALDGVVARPEAESARPLVALVRRFKEDWENVADVSPDAATATLQLLVVDRAHRQQVLRAWLLAVLGDATPASPKEWAAIETITRGFIDDALHAMRTGEGIVKNADGGIQSAASVVELMLAPAEVMPVSLELTLMLGTASDHDLVYQRVGELEPGLVGGAALVVEGIVRPRRELPDGPSGEVATIAVEIDVVVAMSVRAEGVEEARAIAARSAGSFMRELRGLLPVGVAARTSILRAEARAEPAPPAPDLGALWDRYGPPPEGPFREVSAPGPDRIGLLLTKPRDRARVDLLMARLLAVHDHEPFEGISALWDAAEQCAQGSDGGYFPRLLAAVGLVRARHTIRNTHRELLWGLVIAGREGESSAIYHEMVATWYGKASRELVESTERGAFLPFPDRPAIGDIDSCEALFANWRHLEPTAALLQEHCPYASRLIRTWMAAFGSGAAFSAWSRHSGLETSAFIRQIYDVRNRTRHQGGAHHACQPQAKRFWALCRLILDELMWEAASEPGPLSEVWGRVVQRHRQVQEYAKESGNRYLTAAALLEHRLVPRARLDAERGLRRGT